MICNQESMIYDISRYEPVLEKRNIIWYIFTIIYNITARGWE
jgi:hypothetical protein